MGVMGGIPRFLKLYDTTLNTGDAAPITKIDTGSTLTFANLRAFFGRFAQGGRNKFAVCSPEFLYMLEDAAAASMLTSAVATRLMNVSGNEYTFPRFSYKTRTFDIGDITLTVIADKNLSNSTPYFYDGANVAKHQNMMFVIDPKHIGLSYMEMPEYGVLAPKMVEITQTNNKLSKSIEVMYGCTLSMDNLAAHGAYGIVG
jgi:hypothetical protein